MADSVYYWQFVSNTGDAWWGVTYADTGLYYIGQTGYSGAGTYYVDNEYRTGYEYGWQGQNAVWAYYDSGTGRYYTPDYYAYYGLSAGLYIGNEIDSITFNHLDADFFGAGGRYIANYDFV